jgi:hypothetical protein
MTAPDNSPAFPQLATARKRGDERFHERQDPLPFDLLDFWRWSASDLASNALRGRLAEYLVAKALGVAEGVRAEWDACDLVLGDGLTIEVKSSAYVQTWAQGALSGICFRIQPTRAWSAATNRMAPVEARRRQADLYVFAVLAHKEKSTLDPLDVSQWEFYVLPSRVLNARVGLQKRIVLSRLVALGAERCAWSGLRDLLRQVTASAASDAPLEEHS